MDKKIRLSKTIHFDEALELFTNETRATEIAKVLCEKHMIEYDETEGRKVRNWLNPALHSAPDENTPPKVLIYDIETTLLLAEVWRAGKMNYLHASNVRGHTEIITIAYKWLGDNEVKTLRWDNKTKSDKKLVKDFLKIYNTADAVVGVNNKSFDDKLIHTRAAFYRMFVNTLVKSIDIQRQARSIFRMDSYSMKYMAEYFGLTHKLSHAGIQMWRDIQWGTKKKSEAALTEMIDYNIGDIVTTEELFYVIQLYAKHQIHFGVMLGKAKWTCPDTGSSNVKLFNTTWTAAGSVKRVMKSKSTKRLYTISNTAYLQFLRETIK
tara:strand:+ start:5091 stop:6056 length:966 start_codon:yes stop_codon:yes gene_type:complete